MMSLQGMVTAALKGDIKIGREKKEDECWTVKANCGEIISSELEET